MAICSSVQTIAASECIGDSLVKINNNFANLNTDACALLTLINALSAQVAQVIPVGAIQAFAMATAPTGWLICNGITVPNGSGTVQSQTANFASLYSAVGTTYGAAGALPDLRGYFVRGSGTNSDGTAAGTFGQKQQDAIQAFGLNNAAGGGTLKGILASTTRTERFPTYDAFNGVAEGAEFADGGTGSITRATNNYADETRPKNIALLYCIKY